MIGSPQDMVSQFHSLETAPLRNGLARFLPLAIPEVWLRFLLALLGLLLAFAAAMFSTVARESGNVVATAVLASLALLLASVVGLTTVPYLAGRIAVERVRQTFDYEVTRVGVIYLALAIVLGLAALNTGNNLLFVVVSALLAAIVVSAIASGTMLRSLVLEVRMPEHVFAARPAMAHITLRNARRFLPAFSINVVPLRTKKPATEWRWERQVFGVPRQRPAERQWIRLPDRVLRRRFLAGQRSGIFEGAVYFPYVPKKSSASAEAALNFPQRGVYSEEKFGLSTRFPFSFLNKTRRVPLARRIVVFPPVEATDELLDVLPLITGEFESYVRGRGHDLYRIREYAPEDSARYVDWKASAKAGSLLIREFTREDERKVRIVFDNPAPGAVSPLAYERAVNLAASLAWHFSNQSSEVSFVAPGYGAATDKYQFLTYLAEVQPHISESVLDKLHITDDYNLILTTRPRGSFPTALWSCSYFLFIQDPS